MDDLTLTLSLGAPATGVFQALATVDGLRGWWTRFCDSEGPDGNVIHFRFPKAGFFARMQVLDQQPDQLVLWKCIDSRHPKDSGFSDLKDWVGTTIRFQIAAEGDAACRLDFTHEGLLPKLECYDSCRSGWSYYLGESLRAFVETGTGKPFDDDSEDNI